MATIDFYETLQLPRTCSQEDIAEAYRRLAIKYHPKNAEPSQVASQEYNFHKVAEAYEVLSNPSRRNIYDIYGISGLHNGTISVEDRKDLESGIKNNVKLNKIYKYTGNAHEIFERFMGTSNPYAFTSDNKHLIKDKKEEKEEKVVNKAKPIEIDLECTLEELYVGAYKKITFIRDVLASDKLTIIKKEIEKHIEIEPGYNGTTTLVYEGKGNESPGMEPSDLIVHIKEAHSDLYKRVNQNDLVYFQKLSLAQAISGAPVILTTLDKRVLRIAIDSVITPQTVKIIAGEGMPLYRKEIDVRDMQQKKGNLFIKFDIQFPEYIDPTKKERITKLLNENE